MLRLFSESLLPVFLAAGAGYALAAALRLSPRPIAQMAFYVLAPCLVFRLLVDSEIAGEAVVRMVLFALASLAAVAALAGLAAKTMGCSRRLSTAVVLVVLLPNAGNYGLPASLFAFGEDGLAQASLFFVTSAIVTFTAGVLVASWGQSGLRHAVIGLWKVPAVWAVVAALVMVRAGWSLPLPLNRTVGLFADASIPVFLIVLGMQLRSVGTMAEPRVLALATGARLVGGAAIGLLLASLFGLEGSAHQAGVLQSGMPSAVISIVLATEYDLEPAFVTSAVFVSTLASPLTLTPLLALLGG